MAQAGKGVSGRCVSGSNNPLGACWVPMLTTSADAKQVGRELGPRGCCSISHHSEPVGPVLRAPGSHPEVSRGPEHCGHWALVEKGGGCQKQWVPPTSRVSG